MLGQISYYSKVVSGVDVDEKARYEYDFRVS